MPLKPCPFCGGERLYSELQFRPGADDNWQVVCQDCGVSMEGKDKDEAEKLWNTRMPALELTAEETGMVISCMIFTESQGMIARAEDEAFKSLKAKLESCQH